MELNVTDRQILAKLREGRCTPRYLADELSRDKSYISQRLKRLREEEYIVRIHRGLYKHTEIEETTISAEEKAESLDKQELIAASETSGSHTLQAQKNVLDELAVEVEFETPEIKTAASQINQSGTDEEQEILESVFQNLLWSLLRDKSLSNSELRDVGNRIGEHLSDTDFRDGLQYTTAIKQQLADHPNIELQIVNNSRRIIYTDESILIYL